MDDNTKLKINRILAALSDGLIMFVIFWAIFIFPLIDLLNALKAGTNNSNHILILTGALLGGMLFDILYLFISSVALKGSSLGMKLFGITYVKYDGTTPKAYELFFHSLALVIALISTLGIFAFVDLLSLLFNKMGKSFHDIFFSMKMVNIYDL